MGEQHLDRHLYTLAYREIAYYRLHGGLVRLGDAQIAQATDVGHALHGLLEAHWPAWLTSSP